MRYHKEKVIDKGVERRGSLVGMKIGIITLGRIQGNQQSFYNLQDIGMARAFAEAGNRVILYRLTKDLQKEEMDHNIRIVHRRVSGIGKQSLTGFSFLDKTLERLICFSDNQICFAQLDRWCKYHGIILQPYIGVLKSNHEKWQVRCITNFLGKSNIKKYRTMRVYAKTPEVQRQLEQLGAYDSKLVPVCLDKQLLKKEALEENRDNIKRLFGYEKNDKVILFIGRMNEEKNPLGMVDLFSRISEKYPESRLCMVGKGNLYEKVRERIQSNNLDNKVTLIQSVPNDEIWKLFLISKCFVNLNVHEIYGMSILEAMYYECPVIAWEAPGPSYIIEHEKNGFLCNSTQEVEERIEMVLQSGHFSLHTREHIEKNFFWEHVIEKFIS